jgi:hypothetical protein
MNQHDLERKVHKELNEEVEVEPPKKVIPPVSPKSAADTLVQPRTPRDETKTPATAPPTSAIPPTHSEKKASEAIIERSPAATLELPQLRIHPINLKEIQLDMALPRVTVSTSAAQPLSPPVITRAPSLTPTALGKEPPKVSLYSCSPSGLRLPRGVCVPATLVSRQFIEAVPQLVLPGQGTPEEKPIKTEEVGLRTDNHPESEGSIPSAGTDLVELLFEPVGSGGLGGILSGGRSCVILAEEAERKQYTWLLVYLLLQVYRCQHGGARMQVPGKFDAKDYRLADGKATIIRECPSVIGDLTPRLKELTSGPPGFVVLCCGPEEATRLVNSLKLELAGVDVLGLRLANQDSSSVLSTLRAAFGFVDGSLADLDTAAAILERRFHDRLRSYQDRVDVSLRLRSPRVADSEGPESDEHYWTKLYLAWLYRNDDPKVEAYEGNKVTDVSVEKTRYEVETLYGTGTDPLTKLNDTCIKYGSWEDVRIVVPNFNAILFMRDLLRFERYWRDRKWTISLWTLDFSQKEARAEAGLKRLKDLAQEIRRMLRSAQR